MGKTGARVAEGKAAKHKTRALTTPLVEGKGEPEALTRERVEQQDPTSPYLFMEKGESIKTNLVEFMEQLTIIAGVEFGNAFNCLRLGDYFTYAVEPHRSTDANHLCALRKLDEEIADTANAAEKR